MNKEASPANAVQNYPSNVIKYPTQNRQSDSAKRYTGTRSKKNSVTSTKKRTSNAIGTKSAVKTVKNDNLHDDRVSRKDLRKQKNRYRLTTFLLVTVLLFICVFISLKVLFVVNRVQVQGSERYTEEEISTFCNIPRQENIFKIDVENIATLLYDNFTYIEKADVQRKLPDKILITITDCVPTYYTVTLDGEMNTYTVLSQNFKYLTAQASRPDNLIEISCDMADETAKNLFAQMLDFLNQGEYENITKIAISTSSEISIVYDDRITVKLGTIMDMEYKLKLSYYVIRNELEENQTGTMDSTQAGSAVFKPEL